MKKLSIRTPLPTLVLAASQRKRRYLVEWGWLLAVLVAFGGYIANSQYQEYIHTDVLERERLTSQASVIEKNLVPQIVSVSKALESIRDDLPNSQVQKDGQLWMNRRLQVLGETLLSVRTMLVVNAAGTITAANSEKLIGASLAHREWFQLAARNNTPQTLYVIEPIKSLLNTYAIALARSISGPDGEFAGVVYASLHPDFARTLLDSVRYSPDSAATLVHGDGKLFVMVPERENIAGFDLATPDTLFTRHRNSGQPSSVFTDIARIAGKVRIVAYRTIQPDNLSMDKSLVVAVSRDHETIFAPWRRTFAIAGGMFGLLALTACLSLYFYQRRQRALDTLADRHELERKQAELELEQLNQDLEQRIADRTQALLIAKDAAEAANAAKSTFLSSMSHELRTPLNSVLGYAQLFALDEQASENSRANAAQIDAAGRHLLALVDDILDLARIESGRMDIHLEEVVLGEVLDECRKLIEPQAQARNIVLEMAPMPVRLLADRTRLSQVLLNLLSNAVKYNRDGGLVTVHGAEQPADRYRISVTDSGPGIPVERLGELFQPFNRLGAEMGTIEGTGIGLVITKTLVESMDGRIGVESQVGTGSTFWVEFPLA